MHICNINFQRKFADRENVDLIIKTFHANKLIGEENTSVLNLNTSKVKV